MSTSIAPSTVHALAQTARDTRNDDHVWKLDQDLAHTRNAHHSNTESEMREALEGDHNWLEGDLRVDDGGGLVMAHDVEAEGSGLSLDQWLEVGKAGERGLKVDVKEPEAVPALVEQLKASGIPGERLMVNVDAKTSVGEIRRIREQLPDAWIAITPKHGKDGYSQQALQDAMERGRAAGGNVAYPIRWDIATDDVIQTLKRNGEGRVSIWTNKSEGTPDDTEAETRRLRERGVDGVIDLGPPSGSGDKLRQKGKDAFETGGRLVGAAVDTAKDGVEALAKAPGKVIGAIGGLFGD